MAYKNIHTSQDARYGRFLETSGEGELLILFKQWLDRASNGTLADFCDFLGTCDVSLGDVATEKEAWALMAVWYENPEQGFEVLEGLSAWP